MKPLLSAKELIKKYWKFSLNTAKHQNTDNEKNSADSEKTDFFVIDDTESNAPQQVKEHNVAAFHSFLEIMGEETVEPEIPVTSEDDNRDSCDKQDTIHHSSKKKNIRKLLNEIYDWADAVSMAFVLVILIFTFVFRVVKVDGYSMLPTLKNYDNVVIHSINYRPTAGDIVVLTLDKPVPGIGNKPLIKRIIATGGQMIFFDFETSTLIIDGVAVNEPYIAEQMLPSVFSSYQDQMPIIVPAGQIFFLGDNRNESFDSSEKVVGCVDERHIMGKVFFRIFPLNSFGRIKNNGS